MSTSGAELGEGGIRKSPRNLSNISLKGLDSESSSSSDSDFDDTTNIPQKRTKKISKNDQNQVQQPIASGSTKIESPVPEGNQSTTIVQGGSAVDNEVKQEGPVLKEDPTVAVNQPIASVSTPSSAEIVGRSRGLRRRYTPEDSEEDKATKKPKKRPKKMASKKSNSKLLVSSALKCQNCSKLVVTPLSNCTNGHLICGRCAKTNDEPCPAMSPRCGQPLSACYYADALLKETIDSTLPCPNAKFGCEEKLKHWEFIQHLDQCDSKPIKCSFTDKKDCGGLETSMKTYLKHLIDVHGAENIRNPDTEGPEFWHNLSLTTTELKGQGVHCFEIGYFKYDGQEFLLHSLRKDGSIFWWITIIGPERDAKKYKFNVWIRSSEQSKTPDVQLSWSKFQVRSIDYWDLEKILESGDFVSTHVACLEKFKTDSFLDDGVAYEYSMLFGIEIIPQQL